MGAQSAHITAGSFYGVWKDEDFPGGLPAREPWMRAGESGGAWADDEGKSVYNVGRRALEEVANVGEGFFCHGDAGVDGACTDVRREHDVVQPV